MTTNNNKAIQYYVLWITSRTKKWTIKIEFTKSVFGYGMFYCNYSCQLSNIIYTYHFSVLKLLATVTFWPWWVTLIINAYFKYFTEPEGCSKTGQASTCTKTRMADKHQWLLSDLGELL